MKEEFITPNIKPFKINEVRIIKRKNDSKLVLDLQ